MTFQVIQNRIIEHVFRHSNRNSNYYCSYNCVQQSNYVYYYYLSFHYLFVFTFKFSTNWLAALRIQSAPSANIHVLMEKVRNTCTTHTQFRRQQVFFFNLIIFFRKLWIHFNAMAIVHLICVFDRQWEKFLFHLFFLFFSCSSKVQLEVLWVVIWLFFFFFFRSIFYKLYV